MGTNKLGSWFKYENGQLSVETKEKLLDKWTPFLDRHGWVSFKDGKTSFAKNKWFNFAISFARCVPEGEDFFDYLSLRLTKEIEGETTFTEEEWLELRIVLYLLARCWLNQMLDIIEFYTGGNVEGTEFMGQSSWR